MAAEAPTRTPSIGGALLETFFRARAAALATAEIADAARHLGEPVEAIAGELDPRDPPLWALVQDELDRAQRARETHDARVEAERQSRADVTTLEVLLLIAGLLLLVTLVGGLVAGLVTYVVTDVVSQARWLLPDTPWLYIGQGLAGVALVVVGDRFVGRRIPKDEREARAERFEELEQQLSAAEEALETALREKVILPELRRRVALRLDDSYELTLAVESWVGLAEPFDARFEVATPAHAELERILGQRSGASVGIAGPRGVGKTTLIEGAARVADADALCVSAAAPVQYEPREFVLHLFALLCEAVLARHDLARGLAAHRPVARRNAPAVAIRVVRGALLRMGVVMIEADDLPPSLRLPPQARTALELLDLIRFQQTHTSGWTGALQTPLASVQNERIRSYARTPMTFPDVVARFRDFVAQLTTEHAVVFGIDELDKMDSGDQAERFLNDIKAIFGVRGCFFLVSVSEDALSRFERRGVPLRDAFDSSFDEIVSVAPLRFEEAKALVRRRVIGVPIPFLALAHCLAGGLPRDLLRIMRRMALDAEASQAPDSLAAVAHRLLRDDLRRKVMATCVAGQHAMEPAKLATIAGWGMDLAAPSGTADGLAATCVLIAGHRDGDEELSAYAYFVLTLLQLFDDALDAARMQEALAAGDEGAGLEALAGARHAFALSARVAWTMVSRFRAAWKLPVLDPPYAAPASGEPEPELSASAGA